MPEERYVPATSRDDYPGIDLSPERAEQLRRLDVPLDDITVDDIVHAVSKNGSSIFFALLRLVEQEHGEEAMRDIARRFGYLAGRSNYRKMQKRFGVTTLGPELLALYEDTVHVLSGVDMATCVSSYDETTCTLRRTRCSFHTGHPPGAGQYCNYMSEGFTQAYHELDPNLLDIEYSKSLCAGDDYCEHKFHYAPGSAGVKDA